MQLKNYMEIMVWEQLDDILESHPDACRCQKCRYDIAALALNSLAPRYVVTEQGETFTKIHSLAQQFSIDILTAITNAIQIVNRQPHHEQTEIK